MARSDTPITWDGRAMLRCARETAIEKCLGASDEMAASAPVQSSPLMTLGGLVNHLRWVEHSWIEHRFVGGPDLGPWTDESPDQEFLDGAALPIDRVLNDYRAQAIRIDAIFASHALDDRSVTALNSGEHPTLRWVLLHLVEETARHNGHLDILRELLDGTTGD